MISPADLKQLCNQHNLAPVFFKDTSTGDTIVSLDGTSPGEGLNINTPEDLKLWSEAPDYPNPLYPWRPYIPGICRDTPDHHRWINWRLFRYEAYRMVTNSAPFRLTEQAALKIVRSLAQISMVHRELPQLFPWLSTASFTLPPPPSSDLLQNQESRGSVEVAISRAGLEALDIIGLCVYCYHHHTEPLDPSPLDDVLPWSSNALRGVVVDLETTTLQDLNTYVQHRVPVYYLCRRDEPTRFSPQLINARDRDGELERSHQNAMSVRRASKANVRKERRAARPASGTAPIQPGKKRFFLKHNDRFKQISKNAFNQAAGKCSIHKYPTGIVEICDVDEDPTDDEGFSDTSPIPDMFFTRGRPQDGRREFLPRIPLADANLLHHHLDNLLPLFLLPHALFDDDLGLLHIHVERIILTTRLVAHGLLTVDTVTRDPRRSAHVFLDPKIGMTSRLHLVVAPFIAMHGIESPPVDLIPEKSVDEETSEVTGPPISCEHLSRNPPEATRSSLAWLLDQFPKDYITLPAPLIAKKPFVVPTGGILRTPPRSQSCLRLWVLEHPDSPLSDAVPSLLSGGYPFRILSTTSTASAPLPPVPRLQSLNRRGLNVDSVYHTNLTRILSRPNARRFVTYGGLLWRLALYYSDVLTSHDLVVSTLNGPTAAASLVEPDLYDDQISTEETAALLGTATDGSTLWPPEAVFYSSDRWVGHWAPVNELWFQNHLVKISDDFNGCFRTRREWLRNGFQVRRKAAQNAVGSEEYATSVCLQHDAQFSPFPPDRLTNL
ncbi:hypothetical protein JVT61DRAFT_2567 [Boletus reticuloceps]|uniref:Uncharacterized protein n=1 Tax=Boletus reticuloceps TaxID=495285 RepID=A0A8I3A1W7_9AGAM|nr:hypothetical protein JVT61DRAFT_2567 [Boletus reticuloceps]